MQGLYDLRSNFNYYYDFYISAKEKNFSEASRKYNIAQSSLSRSVEKLETLFELKLINTNNKGFDLTIDGERLYKELDGFFHTVKLFSSENILENLDVTLTIGQQ